MFSEAPRPEGRGRSAELTALSTPKGFPERYFYFEGCPFLPAGRQGPHSQGWGLGARAGKGR